MKLPTDVVMSVRDLVNSMQPNTPDAYEQLKARLTASYGKTKWQQVNALLDMPPLGERRPSHMMNEMLALIPTGSNKDDAIFLGIFLRKLPATMRDHLAAANHETAAAMAAHTDVLWDARCGDAAVSNITDASLSAVASQNFSRDNRRRSPNRRSPTAARAVPARVAARLPVPTTVFRIPLFSAVTTVGLGREPTSVRHPVPGRKTRPPPWATQRPRRPSLPPGQQNKSKISR
jgi:hypothetical protein